MITSLLSLILLAQTNPPDFWALQMVQNGKQWTVSSKRYSPSGRLLATSKSISGVGGVYSGVNSNGTIWVWGFPSTDNEPFTKTTYSFEGKRTSHHSFPSDYLAGLTKSTAPTQGDPVAVRGQLKGNTKPDGLVILASTEQGKWLTIKGAHQWVQGRTPDEVFLGGFVGHPLYKSSKLTNAWIVNRTTGKSVTLTSAQFRKLLWPAARAAFDRFGAGPFFSNPVSRPGFPQDPAYVVSRLVDPFYTDHDQETEGSAIVYPDGRVILTKYFGSPLLATTMRGQTMYVLTDHSYYRKLGEANLKILYLMKVDPKNGLVRVASAKNATGVSYAFAE
ncbi:MAG: hypothetical protein JNK63_08445 [Chthonomonas sp.]|nr:hypothetical protein [Chthonomonas sp.]